MSRFGYIAKALARKLPTFSRGTAAAEARALPREAQALAAQEARAIHPRPSLLARGKYAVGGAAAGALALTASSAQQAVAQAVDQALDFGTRYVELGAVAGASYLAARYVDLAAGAVVLGLGVYLYQSRAQEVQ